MRPPTEKIIKKEMFLRLRSGRITLVMGVSEAPWGCYEPLKLRSPKYGAKTLNITFANSIPKKWHVGTVDKCPGCHPGGWSSNPRLGKFFFSFFFTEKWFYGTFIKLYLLSSLNFDLHFWPQLKVQHYSSICVRLRLALPKFTGNT